MAGLSNETLAQILNHSRQLCTPQADKMLNGLGGATNLGGYQEYSDKWDNWNFDDPDVPMSQVPAGYQTPPMNYSVNSVNRSGLPDAVKDIMIEGAKNGQNQSFNPLDQIANSMSVGKKTMINENTGQSSSNYGSIKEIIKECLDEYFGGGNLSQIGLFNGKIKIVDNKGNIYSAKLEKTGNVHDKKK